MASNFTSVFSIGETIQFEDLPTAKTLEGEIVGVHFYADETYYKVIVDRDSPRNCRSIITSQRAAKLVQKPLRERIISKLESLTDDQVEKNPNIIFDGLVETVNDIKNETI